MNLHHAIRRQTLDLAIGSQALALALQPRLGDFNRRRLLPVIEKIFDELDVPGRQIRIEKLEVDLGTMPLTAFEEEAERRLEVELRRALETALRETGESNVSRSEAEARRELLERYLVSGTLPFWAPRRADFSLEELVLEMAASDAEGLVEVVRRLGRQTRVLERIVLQLREPGLHALVRRLEPEHAALIIAYVGHVREVHRGEPELRTERVREIPAPLFEEALDRLAPAQSEALKALQRLFARIPAPYRPRPEELVRRALLDEAMLVHAGGKLTEESYVRVLRELFPSPLPEVVERFLLREAAGGLAGNEEFLSAVKAAGARGQGSDEEDAANFVARHVADRRLRQRWVKLLPESTLVRVVQRLAPRRHRELLDAAEVMAAAWAETAPPGHSGQSALTGRRAFWSFLLDFLARNPGGSASVERLATAFSEHVARRYQATAAGRAEAGARLLESASRRARAGGRAGLVAALQRGRQRLLAAWESPSRRRTQEPPPVPPASRDRRRSSSRKGGGNPSADEAEPLYVENAGLVLAGPFLPHLFQTLDLLEKCEDGKVRLREGEAASRAVHLLQHLVDGCTAAPEPALAVNKILCGLPLDTPVEWGIELTEHERETADLLLRSLLANWKIISNTSVAGLRETFLQREGRLHRSAEGWKLRVQRKTVDVLVDEVPWSLSVIFHSWMPEPLLVTW